MENKKDTFANRLSQALSPRKMKQAELSKKSGIWASAISDYINGKYEAKQDKVDIIANTLNVDPAWLMGYDVNMERNYLDFKNIPGIIPIKKLKKIPILGTIACGDPILAVENIDDYFSVDSDIVTGDFALRCKGNSMIEANIFEGDLVFFKETPIVENGQIAAVLIDDEATLKKIYKNESNLILQPCNSNYVPIVLSEDDHKNIRILGEMVGVYSKRSK